MIRPGVIHKLPLVTLYLTERCNSRCVTCDYWRHGTADMGLEAVRALLPSLERLQTRMVLLSGGEPLLNREWSHIAQLLRANGLKLWLLTSGLALAKHAVQVARLFDSVTVSLDGTDGATYAAIRGLDAFDKVCAGVTAAAGAGIPVGLRVTLQRSNFRQLPDFVKLARRLGASHVSFLAVDVGNPHAFGRVEGFEANLALSPADLPELEQLVQRLESEHAADFRTGFIEESPARMRNIHQYFAAVCGLAPFPPVRCNAPEFSAVIGANGSVSPCFFIQGPAGARFRDNLEQPLNGDPMLRLREDIRAGARAECGRCVCSLWREPERRAAADFLLPQDLHV